MDDHRSANTFVSTLPGTRGHAESGFLGGLAHPNKYLIPRAALRARYVPEKRMRQWVGRLEREVAGMSVSGERGGPSDFSCEGRTLAEKECFEVLRIDLGGEPSKLMKGIYPDRAQEQ